MLTPEALAFLGALHAEFEPRRRDLLAARVERRARIAAGELPEFPPETAEIREGEWRVLPAPPEVSFDVTASDPDGDEPSYSWDFGDGDTSTEENPTHTYTGPGTYEAEVTVSDGTDEATDSVTGTVTVEIGPPVGEPDLRIQAPKVVKVKPRQKQAKLRFRVRNARAERRHAEADGAGARQEVSPESIASVKGPPPPKAMLRCN